MSIQAAQNASQSATIKPFWTSVIGPAWVVSLATYLFVVVIRFFAIFGPYSLPELFFLGTAAMWAIPFVVLNEDGRLQIGLSMRGVNASAMVLSAVAGAAGALLLFAAGMLIYGESPNNWCVSIRDYLHFNEMRGLMPTAVMFGLYALPAMILNPIGEEILFRGFIQEMVGARFGRLAGPAVSSLLFGLVYLSIHGIARGAAGLHVIAGPALSAVFLMTCVGLCFSACRSGSRSLWGAIAAHAAFNLTLLALAIHQFVR
jgi:membrane protease YdiL (CAAX protease family)